MEQRHVLDPELWDPVVEVLRRYVGSLSSVLLCTADGDVVAVHGVSESDVALAARLNSMIFTAGGDLMSHTVDTVQLTSGATLTVITAVSAPGSDDHVLSVSATDVSPGVLLMRTRQAADDLSVLLEEKA